MRKQAAWGALAGVVVMAGAVMLAGPAFAAGHTISMEATAYGPSAQDNYPYGPTDYFGQPLTAGDIAVDPSIIPLRTCVKVTGYTSPLLPAGGFIGEADDEGNAIQGYHIDIFLNTSQGQVNNFGIQTVRVTELGPANPNLSGTGACAAYQGGSFATTNSAHGRRMSAASGQAVPFEAPTHFRSATSVTTP